LFSGESISNGYECELLSTDFCYPAKKKEFKCSVGRINSAHLFQFFGALSYAFAYLTKLTSLQTLTVEESTASISIAIRHNF
jgi:hypothetical protein